jgi:hypothetical protein
MWANILKTKKKPPRAWNKLRKVEQDEIIAFVQESLGELVESNLDHEEAELQKAWLKMMCIANHDAMGAGRIRNKRCLVRWKRLYHIVGKFKTAAERDAYLDAEMEKIFGKGGYPAEWVDSLENGGKR